MTNCDYCGTGILFGGKRVGDLRYCNSRCQQAGALLALSRQVPEAQVQELLWKVHQGNCPKCGGSGPVDVHPSYRVWSALVVTNWSSSGQVSCRSCGLKKQLADSAFSLVLGWWGFPWGLIMTPIQVGRNLVKASRPPEALKPSAQLEKAMRTNIAQRLATSAGQAPRPQSYSNPDRNA